MHGCLQTPFLKAKSDFSYTNQHFKLFPRGTAPHQVLNWDILPPFHIVGFVKLCEHFIPFCI